MRISMANPPKNYSKLFLILLLISAASTSSQGATTAQASKQAPTNSTSSPAAQANLASQASGAQNDSLSWLVSSNKLKGNEAIDEADVGAASSNSFQLAASPAALLTQPADWFRLVKHQEASSPALTSVHQVWTASSSGRLGELSPEVISKLHNDVPFLAAYALRPRIVGAADQRQQQELASGDTLSQPAADSYTTPTASSQLQAPATNRAATMEATTELNLQASSPQRSQSLLSSALGAFNEFNVETLSTSKSEHRHRRKTVLKKKDADQAAAAASSPTLPLKRAKGRGGVSQKLARQNNRTNRGRKLRQGKRVGKSRLRDSNKQPGEQLSRFASEGSGQGKRRRSSGAKSVRVRKKGKSKATNSRTSALSKSGRQSRAESAKQPNGDENSLGDSVKGGGGGKTNSGAARKPFYSQAKPSVETGGDQPAAGQPDNSLADEKNRGDGDHGGDEKNQDDEEAELDDSPTLKRVGDDDVEEEGDTVTVMPKFDGVDDDPELPADEGDGPANEGGDSTRSEPEPEREEGSKIGGGGVGGSSELPESNAEPRTRRINRERPLEGGDSGAEGKGLVAGGGLGVTSGGGGDDDDDDDDDDGGSTKTGSPARGTVGDGASGSGGAAGSDGEADESPGRKVADQPGVEFANKDESDDEPAGASGTDAAAGGAGIAGSSDGNSDGNSGGNSGGNSSLDSARKGGVDQSGNGAGTDAGAEMDIDYRDDGPAGAAGPAGKGSARDSDTQGGDRNTEGEDKRRTRPRAKAHDKGDCDDGSYDHFAHHGHHESIKWLRDAIPGEPGEDYPTLSRTNSSSFECSSKKLPGYYADVELRCQVFHICQSDGRQDSFLCPNGTIFSQISSVCVLWNSFDCEDAPKYYHLNALLYKPPDSRGGDDENLRPLSGAREEEGAAIDSLLRAMRRKQSSQADGDKEMPGANDDNADGVRRKTMAANNDEVGPEDEATIQRKSIDSLDGSSRLRSRAEPRRKRRAIVKHVPPKLQSRRVSKLSRRARTKLRVKPKRRA